jgi:hypothetical protein
MSTVLLAVVAAAAVACPVHMLCQMRRGRRTTCGRAPSRAHDVAAVRRRQRDLEARIAELSVQNADDDQSHAPATRG